MRWAVGEMDSSSWPASVGVALPGKRAAWALAWYWCGVATRPEELKVGLVGR